MGRAGGEKKAVRSGTCGEEQKEESPLGAGGPRITLPLHRLAAARPLLLPP